MKLVLDPDRGMGIGLALSVGILDFRSTDCGNDSGKLDMVGLNRFPGLDKQGSEEITMLLLNDMAVHISGMKYFIILFLSAAVAAIMSTVDSALLVFICQG